ncbi:hypothetical protein [Dickeya oryzae]
MKSILIVKSTTKNLSSNWDKSKKHFVGLQPRTITKVHLKQQYQSTKKPAKMRAFLQKNKKTALNIIFKMLNPVDFREDKYEIRD